MRKSGFESRNHLWLRIDALAEVCALWAPSNCAMQSSSRQAQVIKNRNVILSFNASSQTDVTLVYSEELFGVPSLVHIDITYVLTFSAIPPVSSLPPLPLRSPPPRQLQQQTTDHLRWDVIDRLRCVNCTVVHFICIDNFPQDTKTDSLWQWEFKKTPSSFDILQLVHIIDVVDRATAAV